MVFSSNIFLFFFLPVALCLYYVAPARARHAVLTLLSYFFYGWSNPLFVVLMFSSTMVDYIAGRVIAGPAGIRAGHTYAALTPGAARTRSQRWALIASIASNLFMLGFFKYFNFGIDSYNALVASLGFDSARFDVLLRVTLPLGISFYTFQSMSYTIDVYRGHARAMHNLMDFCCYVSMFPQLVAGPIIRFSEVDDQLRNRTHTMEKFCRGICFFILGLSKKILLANPCGKVADTVFDAGSAAALDAWVGVLAYAMQIYFDFSGYSDMAIGLGLMFGFVFAKNFDSPYQSHSITEFWRRWHISLSSWLRDYLYIPLGGNRRGPRRTAINLALVMLLGGLWHGAAWTFIIWGGLHGLFLMIERTVGKRAWYSQWPRPFRVASTFVLVLVTWVFFRAADLPSALGYLANMFGFGHVQEGALLVRGLIYKPYYLMVIGVSALVVWFFPQSWDWTKTITPGKTMLLLGLFIFSVVTMSTQTFNPFIYFTF